MQALPALRLKRPVGHGLLGIDLGTQELGFCIVTRYNCSNDFWPPRVRDSRSHGHLRPHDFLLSRDAGSVFGPTRTGYCTAVSARRASFAARHSAGRPKLPGELPDFGPRDFHAVLTFKGRTPVS